MQPIKRANLDLFEHDADEKILGEIPRHPVGLFFIFFNAFMLIIFILIALYFAVLNQDQVAQGAGIEGAVDVTGLLTAAALTLIILILIGSFVGAYVYEANYIVLTDQKLVFVTAKNIINRRVSQLSIGDVQDVTVDQSTLLARFFKYGTINIETAGEQAHFMFPYANIPHETAKAIVNAHEQNLKEYGN